MTDTINAKGFSLVGFLISIAALAVIGGGIYYLWIESSHPELTQTESPQQSVASVQATVAAAPTTGEFRSSFPKLVARGEAMECDWRVQSDAPESPFDTGKVWTMGDLGRSVANDGQSGTASHAIYRENIVYTWIDTDTNKSGYTFTQSKLAEEKNAFTTAQLQQVDQVTREMIYNCRPWNPEIEKFELPSNILFKEV